MGLIAPLVGAGASLLSTQSQANSAANMGQLSREDAALNRDLSRELQANSIASQEKLANIAQQNYLNSIASGKAQGASGEESFLNAVNQPSQVLDSYLSDLMNNQTKGQNQMLSAAKSNLAAQGVRGGRGATLLNRALGDYTQNSQMAINQARYNDEQARKQALQNYQSNKALMGQQATLR